MKQNRIFRSLSFQPMVSMSLMGLFCVISGVVLPQQAVIDSLQKELELHPAHDSVRLTILNEMVYAYYGINPDKGLETADRAIELATALNIPGKLAASYSNKGVNYWAKGNDSLALDMYLKALSIHAASGNAAGMATMYNNIGLLYFNKSLYDKAIEYHQKAVDKLKLLGDSSRLAIALNNTGVDYQYLADYPKAVDYYLQALSVYNKSGGPQRAGKVEADVYSNLGIVYKNMEEYSSAIAYQEKALTIYEKLNNRQSMAACYGNLGVVFDLQMQHEKAIEYYQKALTVNEVLGNQRRIASDLTNIAIAYTEMKQYEKALPYLQRTLAIYKDADDRNGASITLAKIGEIYLHAPASFLLQQRINPAERYKIAEQYQQEAFQLAKDISALDRQAEALQNLGNLYEAAGQTKKALVSYKQYQVLRDSILNDEMKVEIAKKVTAFEFEKKEALLVHEHDKQFALAEAEINRQRVIRNAAIAGVAGLAIVFLFSFRLYKKKRDAEEKRKEIEFKIQVTDIEMKALRSQMNPHFIFNALNSIRHYVAQNNIKLAEEYLVRFSLLMRQVFENSNHKKVPLADDLHALELYMQIEAARLDNKFNYQIHIDSIIDTENTMIPPLLLQPFVENSIWHGITPKAAGDGLIKINIGRQSEMIRCVIEDNGVGIGTERTPIYEEEKESPSGIGITRTRINLLNHEQKANASLYMYPLDEGTKVEINLPFELNF